MMYHTFTCQRCRGIGDGWVQRNICIDCEEEEYQRLRTNGVLYSDPDAEYVSSEFDDGTLTYHITKGGIFRAITGDIRMVQVGDIVQLRGLDKVWGERMSGPVIFKNKIFVFTGRMDNFTRQQAWDLVLEREGLVDHNVTYSSHYLVVGDKPGAKYERARRYGIRCLSEADFGLAVLANSPSFIPRKNIAIPSQRKDSHEQPKGKRKFKL